MKRFMLFKIVEYYPSGGVRDLLDTSDSLENSVAICANDFLNDENKRFVSEYQIYDTEKFVFCSLDFNSSIYCDNLLEINTRWIAPEFRTCET